MTDPSSDLKPHNHGSSPLPWQAPPLPLLIHVVTGKTRLRGEVEGSAASMHSRQAPIRPAQPRPTRSSLVWFRILPLIAVFIKAACTYLCEVYLYSIRLRYGLL
ncbi:hypothetical protein E2C01_067338 [Portunus trituberculatus]|uniref:Uncharacterized protein n=1 Tax=Portunus trituberculatus TaxID=210409 RepID=A0A5B7HNU9_PORTR|nr:hypothetical protein [Portunus trituberculatus]